LLATKHGNRTMPSAVETLDLRTNPATAPVQGKTPQPPARRHTDTRRYELKYLVEEVRARGVREFLRHHLEHDRYSLGHPGYAYPIYTLYLDSPGLGLYSATCQGHKNRYKLRLRYYDYNPDNPVFFEIKRRVGDVIIKERAPVVRASVARLLAGGYPWREDIAPGGDTEDFQVVRRFCELRDAINATPRVLVHYHREAWVSPRDAKLRVSFDRKLATARYQHTLVPPRWLRADLESVVLELKFNDRFPTWMQELVRNWDLYRCPMAKYVHCTDRLLPSGEGPGDLP
jgi:SPX domain protein involved in polyphosphate accumulation